MARRPSRATWLLLTVLPVCLGLLDACRPHHPQATEGAPGANPSPLNVQAPEANRTEAVSQYNRLRPHFLHRGDNSTGHDALRHRGLPDPFVHPDTTGMQAWIEDGVLVCSPVYLRLTGDPVRGLTLQAGQDRFHASGKAHLIPDGERLLLDDRDGAAALRFIAAHAQQPIRMTLEGRSPTSLQLGPEVRAAIVETVQVADAMAVLQDMALTEKVAQPTSAGETGPR